MPFQLYKITPEEILLVKEITPKDIGVVFDSEMKNLYIYRDPKSESFNEFDSTQIYEQIMMFFVNPHIFIINSVRSNVDDTEIVKSVKNYLSMNLHRVKTFHFQYFWRRILGYKIRMGIKRFKNYENSRIWRSHLSNLTKIRELSILNAIMFLILSFILFFFLIFGLMPLWRSLGILNPAFQIQMENLGFIIGSLMLILLIMSCINWIFVLFPMKFPISPVSLEKANKNSS